MKSLSNISDLTSYLESSGCVPEDLDGLISELALNLAEAATNDGINAQLLFISETCNLEFDEILEIIDDYIDLEELIEEEE